MREVELGWGKVLLVKDNGELHALGHKCPHYGAPLVKGEVWVPTGAPSAGGGLRGRGHGTGVPLEPGLYGGPALPPPGALSSSLARPTVSQTQRMNSTSLSLHTQSISLGSLSPNSTRLPHPVKTDQTATQ